MLQAREQVSGEGTSTPHTSQTEDITSYVFTLATDDTGAWTLASVAASPDFGPPLSFDGSEKRDEAVAGAGLPAPAEPSAEAAANPTAVAPEDITVLADHRKIIGYAARWWNGFNPRYRRWDNDCTNFASQACKAGGMPYIRGWYRSEGVWWYHGQRPTPASWTWAGGDNFFRHLWKYRRAVFRRWWHEAVPGDILFWSFDGSGHIHHVSIINAYRNGVIFYTQHSGPAWNKSIHDGLRPHPRAKVYIGHITA